MTMKEQQRRGLVRDSAVADMSCLVTWRNCLLTDPPRPGRYIVAVQYGQRRDTAIRQWNGDKWLVMNLLPDEMITHWLDGLRDAADLIREAFLENGRAP